MGDGESYSYYMLWLAYGLGRAGGLRCVEGRYMTQTHEGFGAGAGKKGQGKARRPIEHIQHMRHRYLVPKDLLRANAKEKTIISLHK